VPADILTRLLTLLGIGFMVVNVRIFVDFIRYLRRRSTALLTWPGQRPRFYGMFMALGVTLGVLILYKFVFQQRPASHLFGEAMMFLYYAYALPLSLRIGRGFYQDGVWAESGFLPYWQIGGVTWREEDQVTVILISRFKNLARRLVVPGAHYAAARRLLRDKVEAHEVDFTGTGLDLGGHDERQDI
jgi:hypothetical protein